MQRYFEGLALQAKLTEGPLDLGHIFDLGARTWVVFSAAGRLLGEVTASGLKGAVEEAKARWPHPDGGWLVVDTKRNYFMKLVRMSRRLEPSSRYRRRYAVREAGLAVASLAVGLDIGVLELRVRAASPGPRIEPGLDSFGRTEVVIPGDPEGLRLRADRELAEAYVMAVLAGPVAEARHLRRSVTMGCERSPQLCHAFEVVRTHSRLPLAASDRHYRRHLTAHSAAILDGNWDSVETIATELDKRGRLGRADVDALLKKPLRRS